MRRMAREEGRMAPHLLDDVLELAGLLAPDWATIDAGLHASGVPLCAGDADAADKDQAAKDDDATDDKDADQKDAAAKDDADDAADAGKEPDWKAQARKHERRAKQEAKARADAEAKLKEHADANKTEQEKAVTAAREEGKAAAQTEGEKERRADRLEVAVTRLAARGVKVGEDEVRFADPDDVVAYIERAVDRDDLDAGELFDADGKVQTEALTAALVELAEAKPHWLAGPNGAARQAGSSDAGKGAGGAGTALADMSPDDHFKQIRKTP